MAVVKADAYGHGAAPVARAALRAGAIEIGVATIGEALNLRLAGVTAPISAWLHTPGSDFLAAVRHEVEIVVSSLAHLSAAAAAATSVGRHARVGIKIDTGLGRSGVALREWDAIVRALPGLVAEGSVSVESAMTHLAFADDHLHPLNDRQAEALDECVRDLRRAGIAPRRVHMSNSAAALSRPDLSRDMVRAGIAIYGCNPVPDVDDFGLIPAMTLEADVSLVKRVPAGQGVSYNHIWTAPRDTVLGVIACGYADGVPRVLSQRFTAAIGGNRYPAVGRICMDQFVVDLGPDGGGVREGDTAVLFGSGASGEPTAGEWARLADTIDYEILSGVGSRCIRRYVGVDITERKKVMNAVSGTSQ